MQKSEGKSPRASLTEMTEIILPQHTNALGTVFGGVIMSWVDIAAATCALRHANSVVVTASIDALHFLAPIKLGWVVNLKASLNFVSNTSCEVGVRIEAENPLTGERNHTASAFVTMVALKQKDGTPTQIPPLILETDEDRRRHAAAKERRKARLELRNKLEAQRRVEESKPK